MDPAQSECLSRFRFASNPKWRILTKPYGRTWSKEATDELDRIELHDLDAVVMFGVAPAKAHLTIDQAQQSAVGDSHTMGVAGQILQHMLGTSEGWLGIDHPLLITQPTQQGVESAGLGEGSQSAGEA